MPSDDLHHAQLLLRILIGLIELGQLRIDLVLRLLLLEAAGRGQHAVIGDVVLHLLIAERAQALRRLVESPSWFSAADWLPCWAFSVLAMSTGAAPAPGRNWPGSIAPPSAPCPARLALA